MGEKAWNGGGGGASNDSVVGGVDSNDLESNDNVGEQSRTMASEEEQTKNGFVPGSGVLGGRRRSFEQKGDEGSGWRRTGLVEVNERMD